ncbi:MAG: phosphatidylserine decarboxylase [Lachnospiraceae bacterium]|nr:phosphatidylserine decarboxylase [Lachnospiraceae bacterium]
MTKDPFYVRFLYGTRVGAALLKRLTHPRFSRRAARFLDSAGSRWLVPFYIRLHHISMESYAPARYGSFNQFFTRKRDSRYMDIDQDPSHLVSPCDGYLTAYPIGKGSRFHVKHITYSLAKLLRNPQLAAKYEGGLCLVFRLAPYNYHRYCYPDSGKVVQNVSLPGVLHCVRPTALQCRPVYLENSRQYTLADTENFGPLIQMEVGALMVGKIHNHKNQGVIKRGMEKGYFAFGGSTVILLLKKGAVDVNPRIWENSQAGEETPVIYGEWVGTRK